MYWHEIYLLKKLRRIVEIARDENGIAGFRKPPNYSNLHLCIEEGSLLVL